MKDARKQPKRNVLQHVSLQQIPRPVLRYVVITTEKFVKFPDQDS